MSTSQQFCTFYLDKLLFGVESQEIQEVIRCLDLTEVPLAPPTIHGLMNLRGQIVTALDLRRRLELQPRPDGMPVMGVVVRTPEGAVSLLVDEIGDVVEVNDQSFEALPETLHGELRNVIVGVHKLDKQLMHVLNTGRVHGAVESNDRKADR
jgi:purine-binding chemotaxis protein CheW